MCQDLLLEETTFLSIPSAATSRKRPLNLCILGGCLEKVQLYLEFSIDVECVHFGGSKGKQDLSKLRMTMQFCSFVGLAFCCYFYYVKCLWTIGNFYRMTM